MQQECSKSTLLNFLSLYSLAKFLELPEDERIFRENVHIIPKEFDDTNEEEMVL